MMDGEKVVVKTKYNYRWGRYVKDYNCSCPKCGYKYPWEQIGYKYCHECGTKLDWSEYVKAREEER